jgi:hypothetical protein
MSPRLVVALASVLLSALSATPTWAEAERRAPLVAAVDASDDVTIRAVGGPTGAQRRSVDVLGLKVVPQGDQVRFTIRIARVTTSSRFDQLLALTFVDADPALPRVSGQISLRVQHNRSGTAEAGAETDNGGSHTFCLGYPVVAHKAGGLVKLDIDHSCLPPGRLDIRLKSFTTTPRGERRTIYSRDFLRVPGTHDVGGTAGLEPRG